MATLLIAILLLIILVMTFLQWRKVSICMLLILLAGYYIVGSGLLPSLLLTKLQSRFISNQNSYWEDNSIIILLGNGTIKLPNGRVEPTVLAYSRIIHTAQLYLDCARSGHKCLVIISGGDTLHTGIAEADLYGNILQTLGVKTADIRLETKSLNTFKNAEFTSALLQHIPHNEVILVTSGYHMQRALLYFSYFNINAKFSASDYLQSFLTIVPNSYNFVLTDIALHEYLGIIRFHIYNFLGWNKKP